MKNKMVSILAALAIAFGLWMYVITEVDPESDMTFYDIPLTEVGETILNENNLMITAWSAKNVDLRLQGNRIDLNELNEANIILKVDLSKIYEPGVHRIDYTTSFPGNLPSNAFTKLSQYPEYITVTVEKRLSKEVPVNVVYEGAVAENYMPRRGNILLDNQAITVTGPSSVVEKIQQAMIVIDLTDRMESISENYRYTLCDGEGNPIDSEMIIVNVEEVHVDLTIHRFKKVNLDVTIVNGGGATDQNVDWTIDYESIQLSGSDAAMEQVGDTINLGTINLADYTEDTQLTFAIPTYEGVTNDSEVTEVTVDLKFKGLSTKEITLEEFTAVNVPEGYEAEVIAEKLTVTVRGPSAVIDKLTAENMTATVDFTGAEVGTDTYKVTIAFSEAFAQAGILGKPSVSATVQEAEQE